MICSNEFEPLALGIWKSVLESMKDQMVYSICRKGGFFLYDRDSKYEGYSCSKRRRQASLTFGFQTGLFIRNLLRYFGPTYIIWRILMDDCRYQPDGLP